MSGIRIPIDLADTLKKLHDRVADLPKALPDYEVLVRQLGRETADSIETAMLDYEWVDFRGAIVQARRMQERITELEAALVDCEAWIRSAPPPFPTALMRRIGTLLAKEST